MNFDDHLREIAARYSVARSEPFGEHPLANQIRDTWPKAFTDMVGAANVDDLKVVSSPGKGQWAEAPWLAVLHPSVTASARAGFYPVYLFEPGFNTVCLVLGQGAEALARAVGKKEALKELAKRAILLRSNSRRWEQEGFDVGPFVTLKSVSVGTDKDAKNDPWSVSVAFGKRYNITALPSLAVMAEDAVRMLKLYRAIAKNNDLDFASTDVDLVDLKDGAELPKGTLEGAKQVLDHKRLERRTRNPKLVKEVKNRLGYTCMACKFSFSDAYSKLMDGYIEAHHKVPIASLPDHGAMLKPTADDFLVLCSNCHRAIHRAGCPDLPTFLKLLKRIWA